MKADPDLAYALLLAALGEIGGRVGEDLDELIGEARDAGGVLRAEVVRLRWALIRAEAQRDEAQRERARVSEAYWRHVRQSWRAS